MARRREAFRIMRKVALGVPALPVGAPLLELSSERSALGLQGGRVAPFDLIGDDHRREADLQLAAERDEVGVGEHDTAVARAGRPAVDIRGHTMQPDAVAVAALAAIPLVRIVDREGAGSVEIGELLARQVGGHVIDADRRLLVALARLFRSVLAQRHVIVGDQVRSFRRGVTGYRTGCR